MLQGITSYEAFLVSALIFAMTPGLDTVFVLNKALGTGRRSALIASLGINCGVLVHTAIGALGLSAILATSVTAFNVLKWAGAAYLVWLGFRALFTKEVPVGKLLGDQAHEESAWTSFRTGMIANVLNPKVALFVLAFFPQFITHEAAGTPMPFIVLGVSYALVGVVWYLVLAWFAGTAGTVLRKSPSFGRWLNRVSGAIFILLGAKIALTQR